MALIYMLVGPAYRLSLMGAFTAPLVLLLQGFALIAPIDTRHPVSVPANSWLEFHASISLVAYGAFALACIAGVMYLLQERQLKTHQLHSIFYHLPPLTELVRGDHTPAVVGFCALHRGHRERLFYRSPITPHSSGGCDCALAALRGNLASPPSSSGSRQNVWPRLCIIGFSAALALLWGITFTAQSCITCHEPVLRRIEPSHRERGNAGAVRR